MTHDITVCMAQSGVPKYHDHYDDLARLWIGAETQANPDQYNGLPFDGLLSVARDRCIAICNGEVRYSECGTGDLQVWHGRPRSRLWDESRLYIDAAGVKHKNQTDAENANVEIVAKMPRRKGRRVDAGSLGGYDHADVDLGERRASVVVRECAWANVYDTFEFSGNDRSSTIVVNVFGNRNIGNALLTNMQVAGQFCSDMMFEGDTFYVVPKQQEGAGDVPWDDAIAELTVGMKGVTGPMLLSTAFVGYTAPFRIGPRESFKASLYLRRPCPGLRVRFHLEGILSRHVI